MRRLAVDPGHVFAEAGFDLVLGVPVVVVGDDLLVGLLPERTGDSIRRFGVAPRLAVEQRHLIGVGIGFEQVLTAARPEAMPGRL